MRNAPHLKGNQLGIVWNVGSTSILDYHLTDVKTKDNGRRIFLVYENIKTLCAEKGTSICAVEKACSIGNGTLGGYADGVRLPSAKTLKKLSEFFGVSVDELLKEM